MKERAFLDHNASSPLRPEAKEAMIAALAEAGNASSVHDEGRRARMIIETAREDVAALLGLAPAQIVFTSGGTEANVMALSPAWLEGERGMLFISAVEHPSVLQGGQFAAGDIEILPVDGDGVVDVEAARERFARWHGASGGAPFMASVMLANNETGAVQPVETLAAIVHGLGGLFHCDAVQAAGKIPLDAVSRSADLVSISAHKLGGPKGVGALALANGRLGFARPLLRGGGQERGYRAGTENVAGIAGFGVAARIARHERSRACDLAALRDRLETDITRVAPEAEVFSRGAPRLPNTLCFAVPGMEAEKLLIAFDLEGVAVSSGSACSSGKVETSHVLAAMGVPRELARAAIRVSLGWNSDEQGAGRFSAAWERIYGRFQERRRARDGVAVAAWRSENQVERA
jgi:cysteine desulfurase